LDIRGKMARIGDICGTSEDICGNMAQNFCRFPANIAGL